MTTPHIHEWTIGISPVRRGVPGIVTGDESTTRPRVVCTLCEETWVGVPLDCYGGGPDKPDLKAARSVMSDAIAEGKIDDAIAIFLDTHWERVEELIRRRDS